MYTVSLVKGDKRPVKPRWYEDSDENPVNMAKYDCGVLTGHRNGFVVIDCDIKHDVDGRANFLALGDVPPTYTVRTRSGGRHYYYKLSEGQKVPNSVSKLARGVDVRGDGGQVVAPPTAGYEVLDDGEMAPLPEWLYDKISAEAPHEVLTYEGEMIPAGMKYVAMRDFLVYCKKKNYPDLEGLAGAFNELCIDDADFDERKLQDLLKFVHNQVMTDPEVELEDPGYRTAADLLPTTLDFLANPDKAKGLPTGIEAIDRMLGGGKRTGEITVLHAEAKTGKNTLWHYMMYLWLKQGVEIGYASREMSSEYQTIPSLISVICQRSIFQGSQLFNEEERQIREVLKNLHFAPGKGHFPLDEMVAWIETLVSQGVKYFFLDHLHHMLQNPEDYVGISTYMRTLHELTQKYDIHIDLIVQPTKVPRDAKTGLPVELGYDTLRGGASISQNLSNLITMQREYDEYKNKTNIVKLKLIAGRHPLCEEGLARFEYDRNTFRFTDISQYWQEPSMVV